MTSIWMVEGEQIVARSQQRAVWVAGNDTPAIATMDEVALPTMTEIRPDEEHRLQQERLAVVGQWVAGIAHDFNNILSVIILHSQLLRRASGLSEKDRQHLTTIHQQANHASHLIQQILNFSRSSVMERSPMNLLNLLKETSKLLRYTFPSNISFQINWDGQEYLVNADPTRLQQVMMNLAVNARDAMPEGGALDVRLGRLAAPPNGWPPASDVLPGEWLSLSFCDTGLGIQPDVLPHIFKPFFTTKPAGRGTGLGLAQVCEIVRQHEGHIAVESQVGQGTTFTIFLPLLPTNAETAVAAETPITPPRDR